MTSLLAHGVWLTLVLGHASVDLPAVPKVSQRWSQRCASISEGDEGLSYWTMSGRIGALKTFGRGCVLELAEPSAERTVTREEFVS